VTALGPYGDDARFFAAFEGGSAATGRLDAYSDIDLCVVADATLNDALFAALEEALQAIGAFSHVWRRGGRTLAGLRPEVLLPRRFTAFFAVDCSLVVPDTGRMFLEVERHGSAQVLFDPKQWIAPQHMDRAVHEARRQRRLAQNRAAWPVYRMLVDKELARGRPLDAFGFYQALLRMLVELAGMLHRPDRFDFGWRYLHHDLPPDLQATLTDLAYVADRDALAARLPRADALHRDLSRALD
jgi:hypothetical protein